MGSVSSREPLFHELSIYDAIVARRMLVRRRASIIGPFLAVRGPASSVKKGAIVAGNAEAVEPARRKLRIRLKDLMR